MNYSRSLGIELRSLSHLVKRYIDISWGDSFTDNLTGMHGWVIGYIARSKKDVFQRDIEKNFSIRRSTVSRILQLMEKNGYIYRVSVDNDARLKKIVLTEKALGFDRKVAQNQEKLEKTLRADLSDEEIAAFFATIDKMKSNLTENREETK